MEAFTLRTRQWESTGSFRIDATSFELQLHFDPKDLPLDMAAIFFQSEYAEEESLHLYAPSTPALAPNSSLIPRQYLDAFYGENLPLQYQLSVDSNDEGNPFNIEESTDNNKSPSRFARIRSPPRKARQTYQDPDIFIPLMGVRKALCARILNTFIDETRIAYTIWVFDVESGREWYAPIRYLKDFQDLRAATVPLSPAVAQFPFPKVSTFAVFSSLRESQESDSVRFGKVRQLEHFLRALCAMVFCAKLHPDVAELAIHVQSFLGCESAGLFRDNEVEEKEGRELLRELEAPGHDDHQLHIRRLLKRSIQRYTHRLFLLGTMRAIADQYVDAARARGPKLEDIETLEAKGRSELKKRAMQEMERIQAFLDQLQDLILEGCMCDFKSIAERRDFYAIRIFLDGKNGEAYWDRLCREAVREQIEIEVYVPLRSVVSRLLVNGWRHEDMEVQFKMQVRAAAGTQNGWALFPGQRLI
jgi:hypothetical protein